MRCPRPQRRPLIHSGQLAKNTTRIRWTMSLPRMLRRKTRRSTRTLAAPRPSASVAGRRQALSALFNAGRIIGMLDAKLAIGMFNAERALDTFGTGCMTSAKCTISAFSAKHDPRVRHGNDGRRKPHGQCQLAEKPRRAPLVIYHWSKNRRVPLYEFSVGQKSVPCPSDHPENRAKDDLRIAKCLVAKKWTRRKARPFNAQRGTRPFFDHPYFCRGANQPFLSINNGLHCTNTAVRDANDAKHRSQSRANDSAHAKPREHDAQAATIRATSSNEAPATWAMPNARHSATCDASVVMYRTLHAARHMPHAAHAFNALRVTRPAPRKNATSRREWEPRPASCGKARRASRRPCHRRRCQTRCSQARRHPRR